MRTAEHKIQLAQKVLQTDDKNILKTIELLFDQSGEHFDLTNAQKTELDNRLLDIENGTAKFYTMAEAKKIIRRNFKSKK